MLEEGKFFVDRKQPEIDIINWKNNTAKVSQKGFLSKKKNAGVRSKM